MSDIWEHRINRLRSTVLLLNDDLRPLLKESIGVLKAEVLPDDIRGSTVMAVGDVTTHKLHAIDALMPLAVCDMKTKRGPEGEWSRVVDELDGYRQVRISNPPATITPAAWESISEALALWEAERVRTLVVVEGEEDLLSLPAIALAPDEGWIVAYGAPDRGMHLVRCGKEEKEKAIRVMEMMTEDNKGE